MNRLIVVSLLCMSGLMPAHSGNVEDTRQIVDFPESIKQAMLERMRRNWSGLHDIQRALVDNDFKRAAEVAEFGLGLSSLGPNNARQVPYMPAAMQHIGMEMQRRSSRLATVTQEQDLAKAVDGLAQVTGLCVGCHAV